MRAPRVGVWLAGMLLAATPLLANPPLGFAAEHDVVQQGEAIFLHGTDTAPACVQCHGAQAKGGVGPRLAGLGRAYMVRQLDDFSRGVRKNAMMNRVAKHLDATSVQAVTAWLGMLAPHLPSATPALPPSTLKLLTTGDWARGMPACVDCHAATLMGDGRNIPALAGQQQRYLVKRLRHLRALPQPSGTAMRIMSHIASGLSDQEIDDLATALASLDGRALHRSGMAAVDAAPVAAALPTSKPLAAAIRHGEQIFMHTPEQARPFVGKQNRLSCVHCHLNRGRLASAAPMWAAAVRYPLYRKKNHRVNTLAMRVQGCFRYSLNGTPPPADSAVMVDLVAYIHWLGRGQRLGEQPAAHGFPPLAKPARAPDLQRGEGVFRARCALCHGQDGQGSVFRGRVIFPPLWGEHAFNWGAGMHRVDKAAAFIKANMPYGMGGSLSAQEAWDVAAFVESHPRPEDPRFTGDLDETIRRFHAHRDVDFYATAHQR